MRPRHQEALTAATLGKTYGSTNHDLDHLQWSHLSVLTLGMRRDQPKATNNGINMMVPPSTTARPLSGATTTGEYT